jgi:hypothetical protein
MRKYVARVVSTLVALTGLAVYGQMPFQSLKVHIPETVYVAQSQLPAGDYSVRQINVGGDVPYLLFEPVAKGNAVVVATMRNQLDNRLASDKSELKFDRTSVGLALAKVQVEGLNYSFDVIGNHAPVTPTITH